MVRFSEFRVSFVRYALLSAVPIHLLFQLIFHKILFFLDEVLQVCIIFSCLLLKELL